MELILSLPVLVLFGLCTFRENVYGAIAPVEEPDNFLRPLEEMNHSSPPPKTQKSKYWTSNSLILDQIGATNAVKTSTVSRKREVTGTPSIRHLSNLKSHVATKSFYMDSVASDSGSKDQKNSLETQRKAFLDILDKRLLEPQRHKRHHGSSKIKLRYDYVNHRYTITEDSEE